MAKDATQPPASLIPPADRDAPNLGKRSGRQSYWPSIGTKDQIPGWLRDNDFIIDGHPLPTYSYLRSLRLWYCLHMETMNIWTHLIGSVAFVATGFTFFKFTADHTTLQLSTGDNFAFGLSLASAVICFGLSATFHTLRSHSFHVHHFWGRMDIFGICILALGGGSSLNYYALYCNHAARWAYWGLNLGSAVAAAVTLFDTGGGGSKMRTLRGGVFSLLAVSAMLPLFHSAGSLGWKRACVEIGAQWYVAESVSLLIGVCLFVGRLPERLRPGSFDIWGHSHQLFHICAVIGTVFHVVGLTVGYTHRQAHPTC